MKDVPQGKRTVSDDEIVRRMREHPDPAFTTSELAGMFDMSTEGIRGRLEKLQEDHRVEKKKPASRTVIWWAQEDRRQFEFSA